MASRPTDIGNFGESVARLLAVDTLVPNGDDNGNWLTLLFIGAIGKAFDQMDDLAHTETDIYGVLHEQWSKLLDLNRIPDEGLPWLGQFLGVVVDPNLTPNRQRQQIRSHVGWTRGTPQSIVTAVQQYLTDTRTVVLAERDSSEYHFHVTVYASETPDTNAVRAAIVANKPAGLQYTLTVSGASPSDPTFQDIYDNYSTLGTVYTLNTEFEDLYINP